MAADSQRAPVGGRRDNRLGAAWSRGARVRLVDRCLRCRFRDLNDRAITEVEKSSSRAAVKLETEQLNPATVIGRNALKLEPYGGRCTEARINQRARTRRAGARARMLVEVAN